MYRYSHISPQKLLHSAPSYFCYLRVAAKQHHELMGEYLCDNVLSPVELMCFDVIALCHLIKIMQCLIGLKFVSSLKEKMLVLVLLLKLEI